MPHPYVMQWRESHLADWKATDLSPTPADAPATGPQTSADWAAALAAPTPAMTTAAQVLRDTLQQRRAQRPGGAG